MKNRKCNRYPYCMSTNDNNIYSRAPNPNLILRYEFLNDKSDRQTDRHRERQRDRKTERQTDIET